MKNPDKARARKEVARRVRSFFATLQAELTAHGLDDLGSPPILFVIRDWEKTGRLASQKELADALHISPATMAVSLKSLERGGYVEKRGDPADQRCKRVAITEKGRETMELFERNLPYSVREAAQQSALRVVQQLRRNAAIHTKVEPVSAHDEAQGPPRAVRHVMEVAVQVAQRDRVLAPV